MKLGERSHRKIEEFFRDHLGDERFILPEIHFYGGRVSKVITRSLGIEGITIGRRVYILPDNIVINEHRKQRIDEELAVHEIAHVLQYRNEGFFKFLFKYFAAYAENLKKHRSLGRFARAMAYYEIPFEIEARETASKFVHWSRNRRKIG